jgi:hypothetical protein
MKRVNWKWLLPIVQLALALACHVYETHEYRAERRAGAGSHRDPAVTGEPIYESGLEYYVQNSPALAERISQGINFPALVLDYPFRDAYAPVIYERNSAYTYFSICPRDLGFFLGIVLFWYWVGATLDGSRGRNPRIAWPRKARLAALAGGVVFGILTAAYADEMIASNGLPYRQIGAVGMAWASALIAFFGWRLTREFGAGRMAQRWLILGTGALFLAAALWIGGPYGATQAVGEYLRPTTAKMMPLPARCTEDETPPTKLMRVVESQRAFYHLALQKVAVCRSAEVFGQDEMDISWELTDHQRRWLPLKAGCCTYQYRRHVVVIVAGLSENRSVIVQADLIQSR